MGQHRARAHARHAAPSPRRRSFTEPARIAFACAAVIAIAIPAAATATKDSVGTADPTAPDKTATNDHPNHGHGPKSPHSTTTSTPPSSTGSSTTATTSSPPSSTTATTLTSGSGTGTSTTSTAPTSTGPAGTSQILLGADGDAESLSTEISQPLARHLYRDFSQDVPVADMLTAGASGLTWSQVAAMQPGSSIYQDVVRWANVLKTRPGHPLFSFSHEPEQSSRTGLGDADDFKRAFRKVVTVMRDNGATNVRYTWHMTGWSFRADPTSREAAWKWYPGDAYVDVVGPDEYNWYTCGEGLGRWLSLGELVAPALAFARDHGKTLALPEFASYTDSRRATWIQDAHNYLASNRDTIVAAFYFQYHPTNPANQDCVWALNRESEYDAFGAMAQSTAFTP
jgi:hypothetical protein